MFNNNNYYTLKKISQETQIPVQTLYKRLYRRQLPIRIENGLYKIKGEIVPDLLRYDSTGPKNKRVNIVEVVNGKIKEQKKENDQG
ncbi:MAG: hypothetical protein GYA51_11765 [Candidatus Methanofastidiosa archaeon]|nr:hypothetical protein [Candidatus Methanofastidiosa archaeon]